jgi:hypothetical protein
MAIVSSISLDKVGFMCPESIRAANAHHEIAVRLSSDKDATPQRRADALAALQEAYMAIIYGKS